MTSAMPSHNLIPHHESSIIIFYSMCPVGDRRIFRLPLIYGQTHISAKKKTFHHKNDANHATIVYDNLKGP